VWMLIRRTDGQKNRQQINYCCFLYDDFYCRDEKSADNQMSLIFLRTKASLIMTIKEVYILIDVNFSFINRITIIRTLLDFLLTKKAYFDMFSTCSVIFIIENVSSLKTLVQIGHIWVFLNSLSQKFLLSGIYSLIK
jgi:hypothetical protein